MSAGRSRLSALVSAVASVVLGAALLAAPAGAQTPSELFLSEYVEGSSNNKALELFNGTGSPVNLGAGGYNVQMYFNGSPTAGLTINLSGTVANGDVFVLAQSSASPSILAVADQTNGAGWFNGDDAVVLRKGPMFLDVIGQVGFDPGAEWGTGDTSTADNTLRRKAAVVAGDPDGSDAFDPSVDWDGFPVNTVDGLGSHGVEQPVPTVTIPQIQGDGLTSPREGETVITAGVVTGILGNGFFLQDSAGDGDPATSDGMFVFTGSSGARARTPGEEVEVRGTVVEFRASSRPRDLTLTELTGVTVTPASAGNILPGPVAIADRPDEEIFPAGTFGFEALEGMLVAVDDPTVVGPTNRFGELVVVPAGDAGNGSPSGNFLLRPLGGGAVDYNAERILVDDEARLPGGAGSGTRINSPQVDVQVGTEAAGDIVGILDYQFSEYRVQATHGLSEVLSSPTPTSPAGALRTAAPFEGRIATFNVENLFDCVDAPAKDDRASCSPADLAALETQLTKLAAALQEELDTPELVVVEEIENTQVLTGDAAGFVPGTTLPALLPRVSGTAYDAVSVDASDERGIEVGFVFDTSRVTLHDHFLATDVLPDAGGIWDGSVFRAGREPLVGMFTLDDVDLTVVGVHLKSKGGPQFGVDPTEAGDDPLYGAFQPPVRWTEEVRHVQADYLRDLVDLILDERPGGNVVVAGDLNDFEFGEPGEGRHTLARVMDSAEEPLTNLTERVPAASRYSFNFMGNSQALDHMLVTEGLEALHREQAFAHFNADFPVGFGDDPSVTFRASDHDPLVGYFCSDATAPSVSLQLSPDTLWPPNHKHVTVEATVTVDDAADPGAAATLVSVTSNEPDDALGDADGRTTGDIVIVDDDTFRLRAERDETGTGRVYTVTYRATDACGNGATTTAEVAVPITRT
ncbi:MAG TPA: lamin tail domain-containing protein [Actinomycetota bacterium]|nr:lamin tail domain-containing protein [Actinomycetota bacterium]